MRAYPSIERMLVGKWSLRGACEICDLKLTVSLALLERVCGPKYSLWGRRELAHGRAARVAYI